MGLAEQLMASPASPSKALTASLAMSPDSAAGAVSSSWGLGEMLVPSHLGSPKTQEEMLTQGLTVSPDKRDDILASIREDADKTIIVLCALPISAGETIRLLKEECLPHLPISSTEKLALLREHYVVPSMDNVASFRDKILAALVESRTSSLYR